MTDWFARPVLSVSNVEDSLRFYVDQLDLISSWRYDDGGQMRVAQVERQSCAIILADTWPERIGKGLMFISLNVEPATHEAAFAGAGLAANGTRGQGCFGQNGSWGYRLLMIDDPDGNQLFFSYPNETASRKIV